MFFYQVWMTGNFMMCKLAKFFGVKSHTEKVKRFMTIAGQTINEKATIPSSADSLLRVQLTLEETIEMAEAILSKEAENNNKAKDVLDTLNVGLKKLKDVSHELKDKDLDIDLIGVYDAIVDIDYVNTGAAVTFGLDLEAGFDEVHASNMSKFVDGKAVKNELGKVIKGPYYWAPDLTKCIK